MTEVSILLTTLGFPVSLCNRITAAEQIMIATDFLLLHKDIIDKIFTRMDSDNIPYTVAQISLFKALHHYIKRLHSQNIIVDPTIITKNILINELEDMDSIGSGKPASTEAKDEVLMKLTRDTRWRSYKDALTNFLDGILGKKGVPLSYVIRPTIVPPGLHNDPIFTATHTGPAFQDDNKAVFRHLWGSALGDQYEVYIKPYVNSRNGRAAFMALEDHFNGGAYYQIQKVNSAWKAIQETVYNGRKSSMDFSHTVVCSMKPGLTYVKVDKNLIPNRRSAGYLMGWKVTT
jgi:hypothetical protein